MFRLKNVILATLVAMASASVLLPSASAQQAVDTNLKLELGTYEAAIKPLADLAVIEATITYTYSSNGAALIATPVTLAVTEAPPWAAITISPSTIPVPVMAGTPGASAQQTAPAQKAKILISTTGDAPAFTPASIKITATAAPNGNLKGTSAAEQTMIRADFFSIVDAVAQTTIQIATPQSQVAYPVTVQNFGNANTKVFFTVAPEDKPESWQVVSPTPLTLESKQAGGKLTSQTINLMIQTPFRNGYLNEVGAVTMKITSAYALDTTKKGDSTQVSTLTTTKGFYVPGVELVLLVAGIAGVALVAGRRR